MKILKTRKNAGETREKPRQDAVFADKRVVPPAPRSEARMTGTIHLPGEPRAD